MLIECEKCHTKYEAPDSSFGEKGRKVKCDNCGHIWFQKSVREIVYEELSEAVEEIEGQDKQAEVRLYHKGEESVDTSIPLDGVSMKDVLNKIQTELDKEDEDLIEESVD